MKVIIVGGVAGGASCAARLRRLDEKAGILMVERGPYVSYANCGLPYHVGGSIEREESLLVATEQTFRTRFAVDCRTHCEVVGISAERKTVELKDHKTGMVTTEKYDKLVLSPGAAPIRPPLPGIDLPGIFQVRTVPDARSIREWLDRTGTKPKRAVVVGGGFIGLEMVENLVRRGLEVTRGREARPGHAAARSGNGAPRGALHGEARRPARARRRRGRIPAVPRRLAGSPHEFRQEPSRGHRDPGDRRASGDRAGEDGRDRDRLARGDPGR